MLGNSPLKDLLSSALVDSALGDQETRKPPSWTDPQKLDSLVRLARGIEFGN